MPRRLATLMPHARNADHLVLTDQQRVCRLVQRGARQLVAASADAALHIGLARIDSAAASGRDARQHPAISEAVRLVDGGAERQRSQRADTRHRHQPAARRFRAHLVKHALGQPLDFPGHHLDNG